MLIATDPLSLVFVACFLFGLLFMLAAALLGSFNHGTHATHSAGTHAGHTHIGGVAHHPGTHFVAKSGIAKTNHAAGSKASMFTYANPTTIAVFLLGFGAFGYIFHNNVGFILPLTLLLAVVGGLIITAILLVLLSRFFGDSEGETIQDVSDRTGMLGKVSITIQENGIGEILYVSPGGMRKSVPARSIDGRRLEREQEVVVVSYQRGVAEVDTWEHFINHVDQGDIPSEAVPDEDELATLRTLLEEPEPKDTQFVMRKDAQKE